MLVFPEKMVDDPNNKDHYCLLLSDNHDNFILLQISPSFLIPLPYSYIYQRSAVYLVNNPFHFDAFSAEKNAIYEANLPAVNNFFFQSVYQGSFSCYQG